MHTLCLLCALACYLLGAVFLVALYRHACTDRRGWLLSLASAGGALVGLGLIVAGL